MLSDAVGPVWGPQKRLREDTASSRRLVTRSILATDLSAVDEASLDLSGTADHSGLGGLGNLPRASRAGSGKAVT